MPTKKGMSRKEKAAATRRSILDAAKALFTEYGYAGTTVEAVADRAGVAPQTVYYVFHTKAHLLQATFTSLGAGEGEPDHTADRDWVRQAHTSASGTESLALSTANGADIYRRFAPLYPTVIAAMSSEPTVAEAWARLMEARHESIRNQMDHIDSLGELRKELDAETAADISFTVVSIDTYRLLTDQCGWSHERYKQWAHETLCRLLLDD